MSIRRSLGSTSISTSSASGRTATVAAEAASPKVVVIGAKNGSGAAVLTTGPSII